MISEIEPSKEELEIQDDSLLVNQKMKVQDVELF